MNMWAWIVVTVGIVLTAAVVLVLLRQPSAADLSERAGRTPRQGRHAMERPAGPDAEPMDADASAPGTPGGRAVRPGGGGAPPDEEGRR